MDYPKITVVKKERHTGLEPIYIDADRLLEVRGKSSELTCDGSHVTIERRESGNLRGVAFYLGGVFNDWVLGKDDEGSICLTPVKRK